MRPSISLIHNLNNHHSLALVENAADYSNKLNQFYINNKRPTKEDIATFALNYGIDSDIVSNYLLERKRLEFINLNIGQIKSGLKYQEPSEEERERFRTATDKPKTNGEFTHERIFTENSGQVSGLSLPEPLIDIDMGAIRKKTHDRRETREESGIDRRSLSPSSPTTSSSLFPEEFYTVSPIEDTKSLEAFLIAMKRETKFENKLIMSRVLDRTINQSCLQRFIDLKGLDLLSDWLSQIRDKLEQGNKLDNRHNQYIDNLICYINRLPINASDLKYSKIGKKVNNLGKSLTDKSLKHKCENLVNRWKKMIAEIKDSKRRTDKERDRDRSDRDFYDRDREMKDRDRDYYRESGRVDKESYDFDRDSGLKSADSSSSFMRKREPSSDLKSFKKFNSRNEIDDDEKEKDQIKTQQIGSRTAFVNSNSGNYNEYNHKSIMRPTTNDNVMGIGMNVTVNAKKNGTVVGILKKANKMANSEKRRIRWEPESKMEKVKIFKMTDEPNAGPVTEEEYRKIQLEIAKNPHYKLVEDIRLREINMEKENINKQREKSKNAKEILYRMVPQMKWRKPYVLDKGKDYDVAEPELSEEKQLVSALTQKVLGVTYFKEADIPDAPKMGQEKLFEFMDEDIHKIENTRPADKKESGKLSTEALLHLQEMLNSKSLTPEQTKQVYELLKSQMGGVLPGGPITLLGTPTPIVPINPITTSMPINPNFMPIPNKLPVADSTSSQMPVRPVMPFHGMGMVGRPFVPPQYIIGGMNPINPINPVSINPMMDEAKRLELQLKAQKYKTRPCRNYHGPAGCTRGEKCHFIHDPEYEGREIPNFNELDIGKYRPDLKANPAVTSTATGLGNGGNSAMPLPNPNIGNTMPTSASNEGNDNTGFTTSFNPPTGTPTPFRPPMMNPNMLRMMQMNMMNPALMMQLMRGQTPSTNLNPNPNTTQQPQQ